MCEDQPGDWQINTMEEWWKHLIQSLDLVELAGRTVLRSSSAVRIAVPRTLKWNNCKYQYPRDYYSLVSP